ncbi:MAG: L-rhamnonate dehydratase [Thermomicrobiales bacterium]|jgi:L-alanine-DL-glutamate epimerase-like enolase superfamily enzyme|nr:L-rhamnonate dehydratase [Thermomicrobiales bacterium]
MGTDRFKIADVRAYVPTSGREGGDYHAQPGEHWIVDSLIANPMSRYPAYRERRTSWGIDALGGLVVEIETESGEIGIGISHGGDAAGIFIEGHFSRFLIGSDPRDVERLWDQMWRGSLYYGRKGLAICAISAVDLALWDLCGKLRQEPVYKLLGGEAKDAIPCYVTGVQPARYKELGFFGAKMPLPHGPADGFEGLKANVEMVAKAREEVGPDFDLMLDCYMALDVPYTIDLANAVRPYRVRWIEEALPPDDYDGHARVKAACPWQRFTTGEHEYTRYGFRELIMRSCIDMLQPDLTWVGGVTEARKIAGMAAAFDIPVVPHGSGVFSSHFQMAFANTPFQEVLAMSPDGMEIVPLWGDLFSGDPLPERGQIRPPDRPGWGITLDRSRVRRVVTTNR